MDYLKVPELPEYWDEKMFAWIERTREVSDVFNSDGSHTFLAMLLRSVYTPTTGLLAQLEDQKRVIEELGGKVEAMLQKCPNVECCHCSAVICPHKDPLHFHHDGCPSCDWF